MFVYAQLQPPKSMQRVWAMVICKTPHAPMHPSLPLLASAVVVHLPTEIAIVNMHKLLHTFGLTVPTARPHNA